MPLQNTRSEQSTHHADHGFDWGTTSATGTVGDSYDNALAKTVNGVYESEVICSQSWRSCIEVEWATLNRVH